MYGEMQHDIQLYLNQVKWAEQQKILHRVKRDGIPTDPKFREMWYLVRWVCFTINNCEVVEVPEPVMKKSTTA